jgi:hypothetical protein
MQITKGIFVAACLLASSVTVHAQDKEKKCDKYFSVQWIDPEARRTQGMLTLQLAWWDRNSKKFSGICYDERGSQSQYIIVMSDSRAGYEYTTYVPVQQTATTSGTVTGPTGETSTYSGVIYGPTTYVPMTTSTSWTKVAFSVYRSSERLRTEEVSGFWMTHYNTGPYRKALEKALDLIRKDKPASEKKK